MCDGRNFFVQAQEAIHFEYMGRHTLLLLLQGGKDIHKDRRSLTV